MRTLVQVDEVSIEHVHQLVSGYTGRVAERNATQNSLQELQSCLFLL